MNLRRILIPIWILVLLTGPLWDYDLDGGLTVREWAAGTNPLISDGDGDGIPDGIEIRTGLNPKNPDQDGDGIIDGLEARRGGDPRSIDSDGDGILDRFEASLDCDEDGIFAIGEADDDNDGRWDILEPSTSVCRRDTDGDGIPDGDEGLERCIFSTDCDGDGLYDFDESKIGFDRFAADTRRIGLADGTVYLFERDGEDVSPDDDHDGIPDAWETGASPVNWGDFDPQPGQRDLLIEFVRVMGPQTSKFASLPVATSYDLVRDFYGSNNVTLSWRESIITLPSEIRPSFQDQDDLAEFKALLNQTTYAANPYVTTIFIMSQQEQLEPFGDILGATYLRSMLVTVDLSAHVLFTFEDTNANYILRAKPVTESHVITGEPASMEFKKDGQWNKVAFTRGGVRSSGNLYATYTGTPTTGYTVEWTPYWFSGQLTLQFQNGDRFGLRESGMTLQSAQLASTIAHELGHTLGLCHPHENTCLQSFPRANQIEALYDSTMSYNAPDGALHFTELEWTRAKKYLQCAPQLPIFELANGAAASEVISAKYDPAFESGQGQRECGFLAPLELEFYPMENQESSRSPLWLKTYKEFDGRILLGTYILVVGLLGLGTVKLVFGKKKPKHPQTWTAKEFE